MHKKQSRSIAAAVWFGMILSLNLSVEAEHEVSGNRQASLQAVRLAHSGLRIIPFFAPDHGVRRLPTERQWSADAQAIAAAELTALLHSKYSPAAGDPEFVAQSLQQFARYYARYPRIVTLLNRLRSMPWRLRYSRATWQAQAAGTRVRVREVTVLFDPHAGAQVRFHKSCAGNPQCFISPADALLHELLHVGIMLGEMQQFLAQGGMDRTLYPFAHEAEVIERENHFYAAMSAMDGVPRPQRTQHVGEIVPAACPLCIPTIGPRW